MKPSDRIKEIHQAMKVLDGQKTEDPNFHSMTFYEQAILQYLDEKEAGTEIERRGGNYKSDYSLKEK